MLYLALLTELQAYSCPTRHEALHNGSSDIKNIPSARMYSTGTAAGPSARVSVPRAMEGWEARAMVAREVLVLFAMRVMRYCTASLGVWYNLPGWIWRSPWATWPKVALLWARLWTCWPLEIPSVWNYSTVLLLKQFWSMAGRQIRVKEKLQPTGGLWTRQWNKDWERKRRL